MVHSKYLHGTYIRAGHFSHVLADKYTSFNVFSNIILKIYNNMKYPFTLTDSITVILQNITSITNS